MKGIEWEPQYFQHKGSELEIPVFNPVKIDASEDILTLMQQRILANVLFPYYCKNASNNNKKAT